MLDAFRELQSAHKCTREYPFHEHHSLVVPHHGLVFLQWTLVLLRKRGQCLREATEVQDMMLLLMLPLYE